MGRNIRRHADRDTGRTVDQKIGDFRRQNSRFLLAAVVVIPEINRFFFNVSQKFPCQTAHSHFGVTHGGGTVAVNGTEVALTVFQRVAHIEILRHTHKGVVHGTVPVRVIFTDDVADDTRAFLMGVAVSVVQNGLGEEDTPVHGFQAVTRIGNGASHDDA